LFSIVPVLAEIGTARGRCSVRGDLGDLAHHAQASGFRAEGFAGRIGVSSRVLRRIFRKTFGVSIKNWMVRVRTDDVLRRLLGGESIHDIASAVGFSHAKELSRDFRKVHGVTPTAYRIRERAALLILEDNATGQPGNRATGQPGNRATGQPGNRATGQPGNRATWLLE
jgi:AraC-like DNA-binding protein